VALPSKRHAAKPVTPWRAKQESAWPLARRHLWSQSRDSRLTPVLPQATSRPAVKPPAGSPSGNTEAVIGPYPCCDELCRKPTTGITGCCARTDTGHVTAAPARSLMISRGRISPPSSVDSIVSAREYFDTREIDIETIAAQPMSLMGQLHALPHRGIAVRFTPMSRPRQDGFNATLCAITGLMHRSKQRPIRSPRRRARAALAALRGRATVRSRR
jgi:hypothetical protein